MAFSIIEYRSLKLCRNWTAMQYASPTLRCDAELGLEAVRQLLGLRFSS